MSTIADKTAALANTKADIKSALQEQGQQVSDVFSTYGDAIRAIAPGVSSFNGRTGEVSPGADDYSASMIKFTDGQTFQQKYDAGQLTGPAGANGADGAAATINGVNALTLTVTGGGITGTQSGNTYTLDSSELFQSVSDGKSAVAAAITDKGVTTAADATFQQMATNISAIPTGYPAGGASIYFQNNSGSAATIVYVRNSTGAVSSATIQNSGDLVSIPSPKVGVGIYANAKCEIDSEYNYADVYSSDSDSIIVPTATASTGETIIYIV